MDSATANILNTTTQAFYAAQAQSFSATRQVGWQGWQRVLAHMNWCDVDSVRAQGDLSDVHFLDKHKKCVLDVACGNLRFKRYLEQEFTQLSWDYHAVDSCDALVEHVDGVAYTQRDIVSLLVARTFPGAGTGKEAAVSGSSGADRNAGGGADVRAIEGTGANSAARENTNGSAELLPLVNADLCVCFGFFHHVPGMQARKNLLDALLRATRSGGIVALSLWRFMDDAGLAQKARVSHAAAHEHFSEQGIFLNLDKGDYLLGWQKESNVFRYCHYFSDTDINELIESASACATLVDRFRADGRTGTLNEYLVFRVV